MLNNMEAEDSALTIDGNNSATIIFSGTSYPLPPLTDKLELSEKFEQVTTANLVSENEIIVDVPRGSCRVFYVPMKDCNGEAQFTTDLQQAAAHLLQQQSDSLGDGVQSVPGSLFGVESELVQSQLGVEEQLDASGIPLNKEPVAKRKGGWPKGKKRKKEAEDTKAPKAPTTGYVLFLNERRQFYKETNPELPFAEVTKVLGNEWSNLATEEKQKYLDEAEADKRRYREELKAYQQSEAYQAYLKRKKLRALCNTTSDGTCTEGEISEPNPLLEDIDDDESNELYCKVCDQFFNSLHNKKEHLYGRHHLQAITGEFQKDVLENGRPGSEEESLNAGDLSSDLLISLPQVASPMCHQLALNPPGLRGPPNVTQAMQDFIDLTLLREAEIQELRANQERAKAWQLTLNKNILHLQEMESRMEADLKNLVAYGATLSTQLETLRMVPTLFGMINF